MQVINTWMVTILSAPQKLKCFYRSYKEKLHMVYKIQSYWNKLHEIFQFNFNRRGLLLNGVVMGGLFFNFFVFFLKTAQFYYGYKCFASTDVVMWVFLKLL